MTVAIRGTVSNMYNINSYFAKPHPNCSAYVLAFSHHMSSMSVIAVFIL